jgi:hypothetical protein
MNGFISFYTNFAEIRRGCYKSWVIPFNKIQYIISNRQGISLFTSHHGVCLISFTMQFPLKTLTSINIESLNQYIRQKFIESGFERKIKLKQDL